MVWVSIYMSIQTTLKIVEEYDTQIECELNTWIRWSDFECRPFNGHVFRTSPICLINQTIAYLSICRFQVHLELANIFSYLAVKLIFWNVSFHEVISSPSNLIQHVKSHSSYIIRFRKSNCTPWQNRYWCCHWKSKFDIASTFKKIMISLKFFNSLPKITQEWLQPNHQSIHQWDFHHLVHDHST